MSISPQSLARTRDKRSLRIPRKFEDFTLVTSGDVPSEVSHSTYKNVADALKMKGKAGSKRHTFHGDSVCAASRPEHQQSDTNLTTIPDNSSPDSLDVQIETVQSRSSSKNKSPSPPAQEVPISAPASSNRKPQHKQKNSTQTSSDDSVQFTDHNMESCPLDIDGMEIDLMCKETTPANIDFKTQEEPAKKTGHHKRRGVFAPSSGGSGISDSIENLVQEVPIQTIKPQTNQPIKKIDDNVIKKSPFHPSITISNGIRISGPVTKPLVEKKSTSSPPNSLSGATSEGASKAASRKKSRGFSLMLKSPANGSSQTNNNNNCSNPNITNNGNLNRPIVTQQQQQPTKYYNNLPQNMQYGSRLMLNEPIFLPRSVASIAPITTTLQQIANQARKPPFLTKKAEAYISYQEERKFNYMASNHAALLRITKYLEVRDLLNLRLVNKTWKSIIDSDACWKMVRIKESEIIDWTEFIARLNRYRTTDLLIDQYTPSEFEIHSRQILKAFLKPGPYLQRIWFRTVNAAQNKLAMEVACAMNFFAVWDRKITIKWHVKVSISPDGIAYAPLPSKNPQIVEKEQEAGVLLYCYKSLDELVSEQDKTVLVELSDLELLYNKSRKDPNVYIDDLKCVMLAVDVKPI